MLSRQIWAFLLGSILFTIPVLHAEEEDEGIKGDARCINLNKVRAIRIQDNKLIRFEMHGGPDYVNYLPHKCHGLRRDSAIMYKPTLRQLCDLDTVTVLNYVGGGYMRGATCGLGDFFEVEKEEE